MIYRFYKTYFILYLSLKFKTLIQLYRKLRKHRPPFERRLILYKSIQNIRRCGSGIDSSQLRASCLGTTGKFLDDIGGNRLVVNQVFLFGEDPIPTDRLVKPKQLLVVCVRRVADLDPFQNSHLPDSRVIADKIANTF